MHTQTPCKQVNNVAEMFYSHSTHLTLFITISHHLHMDHYNLSPHIKDPPTHLRVLNQCPYPSPGIDECCCVPVKWERWLSACLQMSVLTQCTLLCSVSLNSILFYFFIFFIRNCLLHYTSVTAKRTSCNLEKYQSSFITNHPVAFKNALKMST